MWHVFQHKKMGESSAKYFFVINYVFFVLFFLNVWRYLSIINYQWYRLNLSRGETDPEGLCQSRYCNIL